MTRFGDFHCMMCIQSSISSSGMCRVFMDTKVAQVQRSSSPPHKLLAGRCLANSTLKLVSDISCMAPVQLIFWISFSRVSVLASLKRMFGAGNYFAEAPASWPMILIFGCWQRWTTWESSRNARKWWPVMKRPYFQLAASVVAVGS